MAYPAEIECNGLDCHALTGTRRRPNRIRIALLAMVLLLQSLAAVLPAAAAQSMQARTEASHATTPVPCNRDEMTGQAMPPCCQDDGGSPPCGDPGQCAGDCGLLRSAALLPIVLFAPPALMHQAQIPAVRVVDLRPRLASPGLRPPIFA